MPKIYLIADTHFYHKNIILYEQRPFKDVDEMNYELINNWNSVVNHNDIVFHLGDVSFGDKQKVKNIISKLNGKKYLVMGNHDRRRTVTWWKKVGFDEVFKKKYWLFVNKKLVLLTHVPVTDTQFINIHGHVHSKVDNLTDMHKCVSVEMIGYKPIHINSLL